MTAPRRKSPPPVALPLQSLPKGTNEWASLRHVRTDDLALVYLVLAAPTRAALQQIIHEHEVGAELAEFGLAPAMRILFEGPPGTGKTSAAGTLAAALGLPLMIARQHELAGSMMGDSEKAVARVLDYAANNRAVFLIDEIDGIAAARAADAEGGAAREQMNRAVIAILTAFDAPPKPGSGVIVACTNRVDALDPAVRRRFDIEVPFPLPDDAQRAELIQRTMGGVTDLFDRGFDPPATARSHADIVRACLAEKKRRVLEQIARRKKPVRSTP